MNVNFRSSLTSGQKKQLKKFAHHLDPVVMVGHQGITSSVIEKTEEGLQSHELIKIKFIDYKDEKVALIESLTRSTNSTLVDFIGHVAIVYRPHPDPEQRKIKT